MFGLFKRKNDLLLNWKIPVDDSFELIKNSDSWQYVNADGSRILYFSILTVSGRTSVLGDVYKNMVATITTTNDGWELKGAKDKGAKILVCLFSFIDEDDKKWAQDIYDKIAYIGQ